MKAGKLSESKELICSYGLDLFGLASVSWFLRSLLSLLAKGSIIRVVYIRESIVNMDLTALSRMLITSLPIS